MSAPTVIGPDVTDVTALLEQVWSTFVDDHPLIPSTTGASVDWSASVTVSGVWTGSVSIGLAEEAAIAVCRRMLDTEDPAPDEIADAVGELANMVGGNIKSLMPEPSRLGLPVIARGPTVAASTSHNVCALEFSWHGWPLTLQVHTAPADPERTP